VEGGISFHYFALSIPVINKYVQTPAETNRIKIDLWYVLATIHPNLFVDLTFLLVLSPEQ
jgi:hypothetical protein